MSGEGRSSADILFEVKNRLGVLVAAADGFAGGLNGTTRLQGTVQREHLDICWAHRLPDELEELMELVTEALG